MNTWHMGGEVLSGHVQNILSTQGHSFQADHLTMQTVDLTL